MTPYELIKRKRDGGALSPDDIAAFMRAYTLGEIPDYQMSALLMAVFFTGMDAAELGAWTEACSAPARCSNLSDIPGIKVDKHSTGGVGDKVSLLAGARSRRRAACACR